jgi:hypothetical protein
MQRRDALGLLTATGGALLSPTAAVGADSLLLTDVWTPERAPDQERERGWERER